MKKLIYSALRKTKRLLRKVYSVPNNIVDFALKAKRSNYSFNEKIGMKYTPSMHVDLAQGLLQMISEIKNYDKK